MSSQFNVKGVLSLDGSRFQAGLRQAEHAAQHFGKEVASEVGNKLTSLFAVGALEEGIRRTIEWADNIQNMAKRLGLTVERVQELKIAFRESGVEFEKFAGFMERVEAAKFSMAAGQKVTGPQQSALAMFGLDPSTFVNQTAQETLDAIGRAMKGRNPQEFVGALRTIGGRGAAELAGAFSQGLNEKLDEIKERGDIAGANTIAQLKLVKEEFEALADVMRVKMAPAIAGLAEFITRSFYGNRATLSAVGAYFKTIWQNRGMIGSAFGAGNLMPIMLGLGAAKTAGIESIKGGTDFFQRLNEMMNHMTATPSPERLTMPDIDERRTGQFLTQGRSDAMVAVGNMLGEGRNSVVRLAERQVHILEKIEQNTRPSQNGDSLGLGNE